MFKLPMVTKGLARVMGRSGLILKHYRPEIFTGAGIVGIGVCVVTACVATLKLETILDESRAKVSEIKEAQADEQNTYTAENAQHDLMVVQGRTAISIVKLYAVPAGIGVASIALILGGHRILRKENAALTAAYMGLSEAFKKYRDRVIAEQGKDKDRQYRFGTYQEEIEVTEEDGTTTKQLVEKVGPGEISQYARYFDETSPQFHRSPEKNLAYLRGQQQYANDRLHARGREFRSKAKGFIFLNEIYEELGLPLTEEGQIVGWVDGYGDNCISFGLYDIDSPQARAFINGHTNRVLLDFNVHGVVYDILNKMEYDRKLAKP